MAGITCGTPIATRFRLVAAFFQRSLNSIHLSWKHPRPGWMSQPIIYMHVASAVQPAGALHLSLHQSCVLALLFDAFLTAFR